MQKSKNMPKTKPKAKRSLIKKWSAKSRPPTQADYDLVWNTARRAQLLLADMERAGALRLPFSGHAETVADLDSVLGALP